MPTNDTIIIDLTDDEEQKLFAQLFAEPVPACAGHDECPDCARIDLIFQAVEGAQ